MNTPLNNSLIDNPALWRLSLMLSPEGIDVFARRDSGDEPPVSGRLAFDPAASSAAAAVEEVVYSNPMLLMAFRKVDIVVSGGFTLIVPPGTSTADIDAIFPAPDAAVTLTAPVDSRNEVMFRIDRGVHNFLQRTFDNAVPTHALAVLGNYFTYRSRLGNSSKMFVDLGPESMNVHVFNQLGLAMASCFNCPDINNAAYYALASADVAGLDFSADEIRIAGNADRRAAITPLLRRFARHVMPAIFPTGAGDSAAMSAPFPLAILPLCE